MATRVNAHEERLATLHSIMNVIAILNVGSPRRSASDRWIDLRTLMPEVDSDTDEPWGQFVARPKQTAFEDRANTELLNAPSPMKQTSE